MLFSLLQSVVDRITPTPSPCDSFEPHLAVTTPSRSPTRHGDLPAVYITYSRYTDIDEAQAHRLADLLLYCGFEVRLADKKYQDANGSYHKNVTKWIESNMVRCRVILVVVSRYYPACLEESCDVSPVPQRAAGPSAVHSLGSAMADRGSSRCYQAGETVNENHQRRISELLAKTNQWAEMASAEVQTRVAEAPAKTDISEANTFARLECRMIDGFKNHPDPSRIEEVIPVYLDTRSFDVPVPSYLNCCQRYFIKEVSNRNMCLGPLPASIRNITGDVNDLLARLYSSTEASSTENVC